MLFPAAAYPFVTDNLFTSVTCDESDKTATFTWNVLGVYQNIGWCELAIYTEKPDFSSIDMVDANGPYNKKLVRVYNDTCISGAKVGNTTACQMAYDSFEIGKTYYAAICVCDGAGWTWSKYAYEFVFEAGPILVDDAADLAAGPGEYKLISNITLPATAELTTGTYVFDFNGFTVSGHVKINGADVTFKDTSANGNGGVTCSDDDCIDGSGGKLTVESGRFITTSSGCDGLFIRNTSTINVVINNGYFEGPNCGAQNASTNSAATLIINNGTFRSANAALKVNNGGEIKLFNAQLRGDTITFLLATEASKITLPAGKMVSETANANGYLEIIDAAPPVTDPAKTGDFGIISLAVVAISALVAKKKRK